MLSKDLDGMFRVTDAKKWRGQKTGALQKTKQSFKNRFDSSSEAIACFLLRTKRIFTLFAKNCIFLDKLVQK